MLLKQNFNLVPSLANFEVSAGNKSKDKKDRREKYKMSKKKS